MPLHNTFCTQCGTRLQSVDLQAKDLQSNAVPAVPRCTAPGCDTVITKPGHTLCYKHWKSANAAPKGTPAPAAGDGLLTATALGERLKLSSRKVNGLLAELGWINREGNGWTAAPQAQRLGAVQKRYPQSGVAYVVWPESILINKVVAATAAGLHGEREVEPEPELVRDGGFRDKFPAKHRTTDGHWVRSKAELLIDNWLYMAGIVHAYERQLPIEEDAYCDFYIPSAKVYIEYWGLERDPKYAARMHVKQELYRKYQLQLIELTDEHIRNLDDWLPKRLLQYGIAFS